MSLLYLFGYGLLAAGGFICGLNFYLSFLRYPLYRLLGRPYRWVSGFPLVGSLMVVAVLGFLRVPSWLFWAATALAILDTGGLHWFAGIMFWYRLSPPPPSDPDHMRTD